MQTRIDQLLAAVDRAQTVEASAIELVRGMTDVIKELRSEVARQGFDPTQVDKAIAALGVRTDELAAAVSSGGAAETTEPATPPAPATQPPDTEPAPAPDTEVTPKDASPPSTTPDTEPAPPEMTVAPEGTKLPADAPPPEVPAPTSN